LVFPGRSALRLCGAETTAGCLPLKTKEDAVMTHIEDIQILDDVDLEGIVGGTTKKKAKKKVAKKKKAKKVYKVSAVSNGGSEVSVPAHAVENANGLTPY
jgi:hypothetical protein